MAAIELNQSMAPPRPRPVAAPRGMALVAVLWIVAALSILVIGVSTTVRQQIQLVGLQRDAATGQALGEAANALVLQQLQATRNRPAAATTVTVAVADDRDVPPEAGRLDDEVLETGCCGQGRRPRCGRLRHVALLSHGRGTMFIVEPRCRRCP